MDEFVSLLGAIIGGGGLGAVVLGATQFSAKSRLRGNVKHNTEALKAVEEGGLPARVLQQAIDTDALRLAAMSIRTPGVMVRAYGGLVLGAIAVLALWTWVLPLIGVPGPGELIAELAGAQIAEGEARDEYLAQTRIGLTTTMLLYALLVVAGSGITWFWISARREILVDAQLGEISDLPVSVEQRAFLGAAKRGQAARMRAEQQRQKRTTRRAAKAETDTSEASTGASESDSPAAIS